MTAASTPAPPRLRSKHAGREPRSPDVVLARAATAGVVGGALIAMPLVVPDVWANETSSDPAVDAVTLATLPVAGGIGALVGLPSALAASIAWLATVEGPPERPVLSRFLAALAAAAAVMLMAVAFGAATGPFAVVLVFSLLAAGVAFASAPVLGYRRRPSADPAAGGTAATARAAK